MSLTKRLILTAAVIVAVPLLWYGGMVLSFTAMPPVEEFLYSRRFDSADWKKKSYDSDIMWPTRLRMIDDLMSRRLIDGRRRAEIEDLLGPPDPEYSSETTMSYYLGPERGLMRIDSEMLEIELDASGNVKIYHIHRD